MNHAAPLRRRKSFPVFLTVLIYILAVIFVAPMLLLFITTFKDEGHIFDPFYLPDFTNFDNYVRVIGSSDLLPGLMNSVIITSATLALQILIASMAGYMISRSRERIFRMMYLLIVFGLIIPLQSNMVTIYKIGNAVNMINTMPFLILIYVAGGATFASLIYAAFTKNIPREIEEAARIDGCGMYATFFRVVFPLLMPATRTVIALTIFFSWNDFQGPLIYLNDGKTPTLMLEIYTFKTNIGASAFFSTQWAPIFALCFLATLPMLLFFLLTQKYLDFGAVDGAVKG